MVDEHDDEDRTLPSARAPRTREDADAGVRDCVELMTSGRWVTGRSHVAVAEVHGVHPDTVKKWATNASRIIRIAIEGDADEIRARMVATTDLILARSMGLSVVVDGEDEPVTYAFSAKDALAAIELQAKLLGLITQKHEVTMTEDEARKVLADARKLITAEGT